MINPKKQFLFEISWEICNKVGGIYTVITSKQGRVMERFGDNYFAIGPMFEQNPEFFPDNGGDLAKVAEKLASSGITALVGRWKDGNGPKVILVKFKDVLDKSKVLYELWEDFGVDSTTGGWDYIEPVLFSTMAAKAIENLLPLYEDFDVVAHFHEWMTGAGLLYLNKKVPAVATVFTTHATVLGRAMSGAGADLYGKLQSIDARTEAARYNVAAKHNMEASSARTADCFTTVSEITSMEASRILMVKPDIVLPNGFNVEEIGDYSSNKKAYQSSRERLLAFASKFLSREFPPDNTVIISTSGRYEYHNKGVDLILEAMGEIKEKRDVLRGDIILFLFVIGGFVDMSREKKKGEEEESLTKYSMISTHPLWDQYNDPIVNACQKKNLQNMEGDKINIIYVPVYLNGRDGVLNMEYYDALRGCDLTIYPSSYEPWGYTPLESASYSVPTVVSDIAGFGGWITSNGLQASGIKIIKRLGASFSESARELRNFVASFVNEDETALRGMRKSARKIARYADWEILIRNYVKAYKIANEEKGKRLLGKGKKEMLKPEEILFKGSFSTKPHMRQFSVKSSFPVQIKELKDLARNLWWSWNPDAQELFSMLDRGLFGELRKNPVNLLEAVDMERLKEAAGNRKYMLSFEEVMNRYDRYRLSDKPLLENMKHIGVGKPVAYFSMEFGFHECLKIYSGGLGILSGDYIKSVSDMNIPLVGVGLLYKNGYFRQRITKDGEQRSEYEVNDFSVMPLEEVKRRDGEKLLLSVPFPARALSARVWLVQVGNIPVYLMDTDVPENSPADREITAKLYAGDKKTRIEQEILLGIGGVKLLEDELKITPSVYHMNEGHSAFLVIERIAGFMKKNKLSLECARELVRSSTVFTTHTPVPAGNETFDMSMVEGYLDNYLRDSVADASPKEFYEMGKRNLSGDRNTCEMTVLALRNTFKRNAVSKLHGAVSRKMWEDLWDKYLVEEVPIMHITNGVHVPTWLSGEMKELLSRYSSLNMNEDLLKKEAWERVFNIPEDVLWQAHLKLKKDLFEFMKESLTRTWESQGESPYLLMEILSRMNPAPLTVGFARRFATYKRATLLFKNPERIRKIMGNKKYPVQFVFAGKAHPRDVEAQGLIREIVKISKSEEFLGKIIFLEDYDMEVAKRMVSGVDVWLNNPRRPLEASGTSGQKAGVNGVVNLSILDGWWDEGYDGKNGWAIGGVKEHANPETQDMMDSGSLYDTLEDRVIPAYYTRNGKGVPEKWIELMRHSMASVISEYNTHRMVRDYVEKMYEPSAKRFGELSSDTFRKAGETAELKKSIKSRFSTMSVKSIAVDGIRGDNIDIGDEIKVSLEIDRGQMDRSEIRAEMIIQQEKAAGDGLQYVPMNAVEEKENIIRYECGYRAEKPGKFNYGVRILPGCGGKEDILDLNLVYWG